MHYSFLQLVQNVIQYSSLLELIGCTLIICLLGYLVIMVNTKIIM